MGWQPPEDMESRAVVRRMTQPTPGVVVACEVLAVLLLFACAACAGLAVLAFFVAQSVMHELLGGMAILGSILTIIGAGILGMLIAIYERMAR